MSTSRIISADVIQGVTTAPNYIQNPSGDINTGGWATYKDASQATPEDGTGGSATLTFTRTTSSPLRGDGSFLITTTAADLRGEGASYAFTVPAADFAKPISISFDYNIASGTYVTGDMAVYIYDVTNSTLIQPAGYQIQAMGSTLANKHIATFQTSATGTSYRLIFHRAVSTSSSMTMKIDNVVVGPQVVQYGAPVTDWVSYTPVVTTASGTMTNATVTGRWRRVGDELEGEGSIAFGTPVGTWGSVTVSLPSGLAIDQAKQAPATKVMVTGHAYFRDVGVTNYTGITRSVSGNTGVVEIMATLANATSAELVTISQAVPFAWGDTDVMSFNFRVPVVGWSSTVQMSNDTDTRVVAARYYGCTASLTSSYSDITWSTKETDSHGFISGATVTIPVSGYYDFTGQTFVSGTGAINALIYTKLLKNGATNVAETNYTYHAATTAGVCAAFNFRDVYANAGDTFKIQVGSTITSPVISASNSQNYLQVARVSGPSAIAASESVVMSTNSSPTVAAITGTASVMKWASTTRDSHGGFSPSTGLYTVSVSGTYLVNGMINIAHASITVGNADRAHIFKTGVEWAKGYVLASSTSVLEYSVPVNSLIPCVAGDTLEIRVSSTSSGAASVAGNGVTNYFNVTRVGA